MSQYFSLSFSNRKNSGLIFAYLFLSSFKRDFSRINVSVNCFQKVYPAPGKNTFFHQKRLLPGSNIYTTADNTRLTGHFVRLKM